MSAYHPNHLKNLDLRQLQAATFSQRAAPSMRSSRRWRRTRNYLRPPTLFPKEQACSFEFANIAATTRARSARKKGGVSLQARTSTRPYPVTTRPRGVPRASHTALQRERQQQEQQLNSTTPLSRFEVAGNSPSPSTPSAAAATASDQLMQLVTQVALQESELTTTRAQLKRAERLAEQASSNVALLGHELQRRDER